MDMIGLLIHQTIPAAVLNSNSDGSLVDSEIEPSFFQQILSTEQIGEEAKLDGELNHLNPVSVEDLLASLNDMPLDMLKDLYSLLVGNTELADEVNEDELVDNLVTLIHELFAGQDELGIPLWFQLNTEFQVEQQPNRFVNPTLESQPKLTQPNQEAILKQFNEVFSQVEALLAKVTDEQDLIRISPRMLELLEKWTALTEKYGSETSRNSIFPATPLRESNSETREQSIWKELVSTFQKRNELASNQHYQTNSKVTTKDISKWLQNNFNVQVNGEENVGTQSINSSNQPLSKVEQYVIHMNQNGTTEPVDKQLMDQFQQVMRTSRFLSMNNGANQLSIALRPDNLGEMMVRFTEINGEMTLKIIVSSQATRQILESNIHQLKNMFSPHQVVIEEREAVIENVQGQPEEQVFDEEKEDSDETNQDESSNFDEDSEVIFHEILMNEKV